MTDPTRAEAGDVVLWPGRGLFAVRAVLGKHGGVRTYDLQALEGQADEEHVAVWKCRKVPRPLPSILVKVSRPQARKRRSPGG